MDIISLPEAPSTLWLFPIFFGTFAVVLIGLAVATTWLRAFGVIICALALVGGTTAYLSLTSAIAQYNETVDDRESAIIEEVEDVYGLTLSEDDFAELEFPTEKPKDDFDVYGTISKTVKSGDGFERHDITLIWSDGELLLAGSVDGEQFTELDR